MRFVEYVEMRLVRYLTLRTIIRIDCSETKLKAAELKLEFHRMGNAAKSQHKERAKRERARDRENEKERIRQGNEGSIRGLRKIRREESASWKKKKETTGTEIGNSGLTECEPEEQAGSIWLCLKSRSSAI